jgi:hypothetical protein
MDSNSFGKFWGREQAVMIETSPPGSVEPLISIIQLVKIYLQTCPAQIELPRERLYLIQELLRTLIEPFLLVERILVTRQDVPKDRKNGNVRPGVNEPPGLTWEVIRLEIGQPLLQLGHPDLIL